MMVRHQFSLLFFLVVGWKTWRIAKTNKRTTTSVANYDIELLAAWYEAIRGARGIPSHPSLHNRLTIQDVDPKALPLLIVLLCDFEQFDTTVVKDLLYICRFHPSLLVIVSVTLTLVSVVFTSVAFPSFLFSHYQALLPRRTSTPPIHVLLLHCSVFATFLSHQVPRSSKKFCQR